MNTYTPWIAELANLFPVALDRLDENSLSAYPIQGKMIA